MVGAVKAVGHSSDLLKILLGNVDKHIQMMEFQANRLSVTYPDRELAATFSKLPKKILTIGPMSYCDSLASDLGIKCPKEVLTAIGLVCLPITTHDDVVDETPNKRSQLAAFIYAGDIAMLEGLRVLFSNKYASVAKVLIDAVNQNHYYQQLRVKYLWERTPKTFEAYKVGIRDVPVLVKVGLDCACAVAGASHLIRRRVDQFANGYGIALQIIDDIREVDEDRVSGYNSFPLLEGKPFSESFQELDKEILAAKQALLPKWVKMRSYIDRVERVALEIKKGVRGK